MSAEFSKVVEQINGLAAQPTDEERLNLYKYYKQVTVGDCNTSRPGMFDMAGKYKWDAWNSVKGMTTEEAEQKYIELAREMIAKYGS
jgi:diazepam-binding inhibitor (GABA receptor modulating acyl-CoA-binding protein)